MQVPILIPTLNRQSFVKRIITHYESINSPHPLFIGDATDSLDTNDLLNYIKTVKNVEVNYFNWKGLSYEKTFFKLAKEASLKYDFCTYHGDEDFLIPSSISKCANFLSKNLDYRTAQGRAMQIVIKGSNPIGSKIIWVGEYWGKNSLEQESRIQRLLSFDKNPYVNQFSVHRIKDFISDSIDFATITDNNLHELIHIYSVAINGKSKFIDCFYLVRVRHEGLKLFSPVGLDRVLDDMKKNTYSKEYEKTISSLAKALSKDNEINYEKAKVIISKLMKNKTKRLLSKEKKISGKKKYEFILNEIHKIIYHIINNIGLRNLREELRSKNNFQKLINDKESYLYSDFIAIQNTLLGKK